MKERLTGAIILVALMVLWVPELLTGPIRSAPRASAMAPSAEEPPLRSYTINLADDAHSRSTGATSSGPQQPTPLEAGAPRGSGAAQPGSAESTPPAAASTTHRAPQALPAAPAPVVPARSAPASTAAPTLAAVSVAAGSWVVQLGSFASRSNAERLARQVRAGGFNVSVSRASAGRRLFRVRVGPAHDREAASLLAAKLRAAGHDGSIVPK
ncbi:MAG TPA: SPOR domain-containing protein [Steroidobacteraceae bacterium]|nr:SPOR domain-containing protein [Steroidobacteraceae bacterium]